MPPMPHVLEVQRMELQQMEPTINGETFLMVSWAARVAITTAALLAAALLAKTWCTRKAGGLNGGDASEAAECAFAGSWACEFERLEVASWSAEFLWVGPCTAKQPSRPQVGHKPGPLIIVIPGFPGIAQIYAAFLTVLSASACCTSVCVSWCGHQGVPSTSPEGLPEAAASLEEHALFVTAAVRELRSRAWVTRVVLIGQSLGCWFAAKALEALDGREAAGAPIVQVRLLCPVGLQDLRTAPRAARLRRPLRVARALGLASLARLAALAAPAPTAALLHAIWWLRGKATLSRRERGFWYVLVAHLQAGVLWRALAAAAEALETLGAPDPGLLAPLRSYGAAVALDFAEGDGWTPQELRRGLASADLLPEAQQQTHRMPHGIVTEARAARALAASIAPEMSAALW